MLTEPRLTFSGKVPANDNDLVTTARSDALISYGNNVGWNRHMVEESGGRVSPVFATFRRCEICTGNFPASRADVRWCSNRCRHIHRARGRRPVLRTSANQTWFSPPEIVAAARSVMGGIDLDPASCAEANEIVQAERFYTEDDDGLTQPWHGRVWMNPPYSYLAPKFVERFGQFFPGSVTQACLLLATHHQTTRWFERHLGGLDIVICKPPYRLCFSGSKKQPAHGSMIIGVGVDPAAFEHAFAPFGRSWVQRRR